MSRVCNSKGIWSSVVDNNCVSNGIADKVDLTGKWNFTFGGNEMGIIDIVFNMTSGVGKLSGGKITGGDIDQNTIRYIKDLGYKLYVHQPAKFEDNTYQVLHGGNYKFVRAV
jgi:hypothetical protein